MNKILSRKFIVTIVTAIIVAASDSLGLSPETAQWLVGLASAYILGQGAVDAAEKIGTKNGNPPYFTQ